MLRFLTIISIFAIVGVAFFETQPNHAQAIKKKKYIVVLKNNAEDPETTAQDIKKKHDADYNQVYRSVVKGFAADIPESKIEKIKQDPRVAFVSEDKEVSISARRDATILAQTLPTGINRIDSDLNTTNTGEDVGVAVIDTGIDLTHPDLQANIVANKNCLRPRQTGTDDNGHGTHVAGIIAARNNNQGVVGVAPKAKLIAVKVLNSAGSGTWSSVICGIDWVSANASRYNIKVANLSLGGGGTSDNNCGYTNNDALHRAICNSTAAGVTYVVAAGNENTNAANSVPSSYDDTVITVSALADSDGQSGGLGSPTSYGADDTFATFSNYGNVVDLAAPGVSIYSTYRGGKYATLSGTSMASPHVAGSAALYIKNHPGATWQQVRTGLMAVSEVLSGTQSLQHSEPIVKADSL